jgi:hypothetical protein
MRRFQAINRSPKVGSVIILEKPMKDMSNAWADIRNTERQRKDMSDARAGQESTLMSAASQDLLLLLVCHLCMLWASFCT